jgi:hypothetical protein
MRLISILILLLISKITYAYDLEVNLLTQHYFEDNDTASRFSNKVGDSGRLIANPMFAIKTEDDLRLLAGVNSVGSPMLGITTNPAKHLLFGAYLQDVAEFDKRGILPIYIARRGDIALTPIFGLEFEKRVKGMKAFTIITPALLTIGIGKEF